MRVPALRPISFCLMTGSTAQLALMARKDDPVSGDEMGPTEELMETVPQVGLLRVRDQGLVVRSVFSKLGSVMKFVVQREGVAGEVLVVEDVVVELVELVELDVSAVEEVGSASLLEDDDDDDELTAAALELELELDGWSLQEPYSLWHPLPQ